MTAVLKFLCTWSFFVLAYCSSGDRDFNYSNCVSACETSNCYPGTTNPRALALRITKWSCLDDCKYTCMQSVTSHRIQRGESILQYFGKWPFYRFAGMQEPASVAFSLFNLLVHVFGVNRITIQVPAGHPLKPYYLALSAVSLNAWIWSAVFHTRDTSITEKLDYFSAGLSILFALYIAVIRIFHIYPSQREHLTLSTDKSNSSRPKTRKAWTAFCVSAYLSHITYLGFSSRFNYSYNIIANMIVGMIHNALWLLFSLSNSWIYRYPGRAASYRPPFTRKATIFVIITTAATSLELFDFPPLLGVIDAHSLWHLATIPIAKYWYSFILEDCADDSWRGETKAYLRP